jgi:RNA polymerase sigma-70 factor, ECF subfamily
MTDLPQNRILATAANLPARADEPSPLEAEVVALFDRLRNPLLRYLLSFRSLAVPDCEEIVQETFLALFQHLQRGGARHNLAAWLFRVAHNMGLKRLQRSRRDSRSLVDWAEAPEQAAVDSAPNPEDACLRGEAGARVEAVWQALPELDRRCLVLRAEGLRYREIAEVLEISLGGVAKSLGRSLARMARARER